MVLKVLTEYPLHPFSGAITVVKALDYEKAIKHVFEITATDLGSPANAITTPVTITVLDENDNVPIFKSTTYKKDLAENVEKGQQIAVVEASDGDKTASNNQITFAIAGGDEDPALFAIDGANGIITTLAKLDFEKRNPPVYKLTVTAQDNGSPKRTAIATVEVNVKDKNDQPPIIAVLSHATTVARSKATGLDIATIAATDKDTEADNKKITYVKVSGWDSGHFSLDNVTGYGAYDLYGVTYVDLVSLGAKTMGQRSFLSG